MIKSFLLGVMHALAGLAILFLIAHFSGKVILINDTANATCDGGKVNVAGTEFIRIMHKPKRGEGCLMPMQCLESQRAK
jgi:hypothetical protein